MREGNRVVGHVVHREPEYSRDDVRLLVAQMMWERSLGPHGYPLDEATSADADPDNHDAKFRFTVGDPVRDFAEKAQKDAEDAYRKQWPDANMNGLVFQVKKESRPTK